MEPGPRVLQEEPLCLWGGGSWPDHVSTPASCRDSLISLLGSDLSAALSSSPVAVLCVAAVRGLRQEVSSQALPALR